MNTVTTTARDRSHYEHQSMIFIPSDTPYIELDNGDNADLYHYKYNEVANDANRHLKQNWEAFGNEIELRWNQHYILDGALTILAKKLSITRIYATVVTALFIAYYFYN